MSNYTNIIELVILLNLFFLFNVFVLYPAIIFIASKFIRNTYQIIKANKPDIAIIISAHNEEKLIEEAIISIYESGYPVDKISCIVGSDGSTDNTIGILEKLHERYKSLEFYDYKRAGKNFVLNQLVPKSKSEIIFYMDADLRIAPETLDRLTGILSEESVGAVLSSVKFAGKDVNAGGFGEYLYQQYETKLRIHESNIVSSINSLGTLYGIKKSLYNEIPNNLVCDDLYRLLATALQNKRIIFDDKSVVIEVREKAVTEEIKRRKRVVSGGLSTVLACRKILNPAYGWVSFFVWNHKVLRWLSPVYLILIAIGTFLLNIESWLFYPLCITQAILYGGAALGWGFEKFKFNILPLRILLFAVSMNLGFLLGIARFIAGGQNAMWGRIDSER